MKAADLVVAFILVVVGGIVVFDSVRIGFGWGTDGPASGFLPFWLGVILIGTAIAIAVQAAAKTDGTVFVTRAQLGPVLKVLVPAAALVLFTQLIGLYVSSAIYLALYMRWIGRHRWTAIAGVAIGVPVVTFLIFEKWFLVPMPKGPFETWLGH